MAAMREFLDQEQAGQLDQLNGAIVHLESTHPGAPARAMVIYDAPQPVEPHVFIRGNPGRPGKAVPRRFLRVLSEPDRRPFQKGSGRLEMAEAIADPKNPLTARVLVNRAWLWHFGKGLVSTPAISGCAATRPAIPSCSTIWRANSSPRAGRSSRCTGGSCFRARINSAAIPAADGLRARS